MHVIATAGHVDHGKSTLVRALTGMEPDRWAEERRRGMTIDLGYAWTVLPSGETLAFVDVPGHQRFVGNMLAGLGPAPAVMFVVAADEGWRQQSEEHLAAADALGLQHGLLVVTRSDLADPAPAIEAAQQHLSASSLGSVRAVPVSGRTGSGLAELRSALSGLVAELPPPRIDRRVRLWIDRAFTIRGSGTVVTGTLGEGRIRVGDRLALNEDLVQVRGLQSLGQQIDMAEATARVAVNLRGVPRDAVGRGDALLTPAGWRLTARLDVKLTSPAADLPAELTLHIGTAAVKAQVRALAASTARLALDHPLPLESGDRAILRDPGQKFIAAGVFVVDIDPPEFRQRGAAARRGDELEASKGQLDTLAEVTRRGAIRRSELATLGVPVSRVDGLREASDWLIATATWEDWTAGLCATVDKHAAAHPLNPGVPLEEARQLAQIPNLELLTAVAADTGLETVRGRIQRPGAIPSLGLAEHELVKLENRWATAPFAAPEQTDLDAAGLGAAELAAAAQMGRALRLHDNVVLPPNAPALAMRLLAALPQPFTSSTARQALGTTRRVAIPLLEHLDEKGWTQRVDSNHRRVVGRTRP